LVLQAIKDRKRRVINHNSVRDSTFFASFQIGPNHIHILDQDHTTFIILRCVGEMHHLDAAWLNTIFSWNSGRFRTRRSIARLLL